MRAATNGIAQTFFVASVLASCNQPRQQIETSVTRYGEAKCLPTIGKWQAQGSEFGELMIHNTLDVGERTALWNGVPIDRPSLHRYLREMRHYPAAAMVVVFQPQTTCSEVAAIRRVISAELECGIRRACVEYSEQAWRRQSADHAVSVQQQLPGAQQVSGKVRKWSEPVTAPTSTLSGCVVYTPSPVRLITCQSIAK